MQSGLWSMNNYKKNCIASPTWQRCIVCWFFPKTWWLQQVVSDCELQRSLSSAWCENLEPCFHKLKCFAYWLDLISIPNSRFNYPLVWGQEIDGQLKCAWPTPPANFLIVPSDVFGAGGNFSVCLVSVRPLEIFPTKSERGVDMGHDQEPSILSPVHENAGIKILRKWRSYRNRRIFVYLKHAVCRAEESLTHQVPTDFVRTQSWKFTFNMEISHIIKQRIDFHGWCTQCRPCLLREYTLFRHTAKALRFGSGST